MSSGNQSTLNPSIARYYSDKKALALIYLMTVGAKAIVISEMQQGDKINYINGLIHEAEIKVLMQRDILSNHLVSRLKSKEGVCALKRDRRGRTRSVILRIVIDNGDYLIWKSKFGFRTRKFPLDGDSRVEQITESVQQYVGHNQFLRLVNKQKKVDLNFPASADNRAFKSVIESPEIRNNDCL